MMAWLRCNLRSYVLLALFALALQVVVGAVHFHDEDFGLAGAAGASQVRLAGDDDVPAPPAGHHPDDRNLCAVCASVGLAAAPLVAAPPALAVPLPTRFAWSPSDFTAELPDRAFGLFRARAPPV